MKRFLKLAVLSFMLLLTVPSFHAETFQQIEGVYVKDINNASSQSKPVEIKFCNQVTAGSSTRYVKFYIPKNSVVNIGLNCDIDKPKNYSEVRCEIYRDSSMKNFVTSLKTSTRSKTDASVMNRLATGYYYVKVYTCNVKAEEDSCVNAYLDITYTDTKNVFDVSVMGDIVSFWNTLNCDVYFGTNMANAQCVDGTSRRITESGSYTIVYSLIDDRALWNTYNTVSYKVLVDINPPIVTGVKNNKTYKKPVVIRFKDTLSGIKYAKLNGKNIKSETKIRKKGSYKLVVVDTKGNKSVVKFKIKSK